MFYWTCKWARYDKPQINGKMARLGKMKSYLRRIKSKTENGAIFLPLPTVNWKKRKKNLVKRIIFNPPSKLLKMANLANFFQFYFSFFGLREGLNSKFRPKTLYACLKTPSPPKFEGTIFKFKNFLIRNFSTWVRCCNKYIDVAGNFVKK